MISLKRTFSVLGSALLALSVFSQTPAEWKPLEKPLNFYLANDLGRNWKNRSMLLQQMNRRMSPISPFGLFLPYIGYQ